MGKPAFYRHEVRQGEDYSVNLDLKNPDGTAFNNSGYTGASNIETLDGTIAASFTVSFPDTDTVTLSLSKTVTAALSPRRYIHDLKLTDAGGLTTYWIEGDVIVSKGVS
ncbi:hypothetical protein [Pantanalinema sp. GBBB05]|uniref:hypothetical protein n=1 Tax=Pantanalinema sp. GBBB05 TaxID=2604139 RepID=UPI001DAAD5AE|nr:hypothetical protein [Pantanalinema sp. GBBB05]